MKSSDVFNEVMKKQNIKEMRSMNNLKSICDSLDERQLDINVKRVGREAEREGLSPKCNTIYNNEVWSSYVKLRASEQLIEVKSSKDVDVHERILVLERENDVLRAFIRNINIK
jgi:hypothetical protein